MENIEDYSLPGKIPESIFKNKLEEYFKSSVSCLPYWDGSFTDLLTDGFDHEQIWAMISITNGELLHRIESCLGKIGNENVEVAEQHSDPCEDSLSEEFVDFEKEESTEIVLSDVEDFDMEADEQLGSEDEMNLFGNEMEDEVEEEQEQEQEENSREDDQPEFENADNDENDTEFEDDDEEKNFDDEDIANMKFDDFFDEENKEFEDESSTPLELNLDSDDEEATEKSLSTFERNQRKLQHQISQLEMENAATEKPWTLRGEVTAKNRPLDSLLEVDVDFESGTKPVPVVTQEFCDNLEQLITQRIKDAMFDDVQRKVAAPTKPINPDSIELDMQKSTKGLAQIYEEEYLNSSTNVAAIKTENPEHAEVKNLFLSLMSKLDALSNYHFTPKIPKTEIQIVSNSSAVSIEEAIPVAVSGDSLISAKEVHRGKMPMTFNEFSKSKKRRIAKVAAKRRHHDDDKRSSDKRKAIKQLSKQKNVFVAKRA